MAAYAPGVGAQWRGPQRGGRGHAWSWGVCLAILQRAACEEHGSRHGLVQGRPDGAGDLNCAPKGMQGFSGAKNLEGLMAGSKVGLQSGWGRRGLGVGRGKGWVWAKTGDLTQKDGILALDQEDDADGRDGG